MKYPIVLTTRRQSDTQTSIEELFAHSSHASFRSWRDLVHHASSEKEKYRYVMLIENTYHLLNPYEAITVDDDVGQQATALYAFTPDAFQQLTAGHHRSGLIINPVLPSNEEKLAELCALGIGWQELYEEIQKINPDKTSLLQNIIYPMVSCLYGEAIGIADFFISMNRTETVLNRELTDDEVHQLNRISSAKAFEFFACKLGTDIGTQGVQLLSKLLRIYPKHMLPHIYSAIGSGLGTALLSTAGVIFYAYDPTGRKDINLEKVPKKFASSFAAGMMSYAMANIPVMSVYNQLDEASDGYLSYVSYALAGLSMLSLLAYVCHRLNGTPTKDFDEAAQVIQQSSPVTQDIKNTSNCSASTKFFNHNKSSEPDNAATNKKPNVKK